MDLARAILDLQPSSLDVVFATASGTNEIDGVTLDAVSPGVTVGDWCVVLVYGDDASAGRLILGKIV